MGDIKRKRREDWEDWEDLEGDGGKYEEDEEVKGTK